MRRSLFGMLCLAGGLAAMAASPRQVQAQNAVIRGSVKADNGEAVVGATVYLVEVAAQAPTDNQGRYVLTVPGDRTRGQQLQLRVRAIGFRPSSRMVTLVAGDQSADFSLVADVNRLDEIVVTGVMEGTEKAKVPFAVSSVDMADVPVPPVDPLRMLAGRVPGANVTSASGRPGSAPAVILRGPTSINAAGRDQGPLYIVDGIIVNGGLPDINPSDIENIEVVKGAAAASLYGARAGNGVIQITTRSGRRAADGMSFNVRGETGASDLERGFNPATTTAMMLDPTGTRFCSQGGTRPLCSATIDWNTEAARVNNPAGDFALTPVTFPLDPASSTPAGALRNAYQATKYPGVIYNPVDQLIQNQGYLNGVVDMTGRFNNTTVFASASALDQAGSIRYLSGFQRYSGRVNVDQRIGTQWTASLRSYYSRNYADGLNEDGGTNSNALNGTAAGGGGSGTAFFRLTRQRAISNLLAVDTLNRLYIRTDMQASGAQNQNPLYVLQNDPDKAVTDRFLGGLDLHFTPIRWADFEGNFSYDLQNYQEYNFDDKGFRTTASTTGNANGANGGFVYKNAQRQQGLNTSINATFRADLTHNIASHYSFRVLYEQQDFDYRRGQGGTLAAVGVPQLSNATAGQSITSLTTQTKQLGLFAGAGFDMWNGRYGVDGLIRRDGSSLFGQDNRWQTFGRISGFVNLALEPWWFAPHALSSFKLRASRGSAGGRPNFFAQYETWNVSAAGVSFGNLGNVNLRPEVTIDNEIGADIELFRKALFTVTHDQSRTENQILQVPNPAEKGFATQWANAGVLSNRTWELQLNIPVVQTRNVSWSWTFGYDRTRTRIDSLSVAPFNYGSTSQATNTIYLAQSGEQYASMYGRKFVTSCSELPTVAFQNDCGGAGKSFQINNDGFIVWAGGTPGSGSAYTWRDGITHNLYEDSLQSPLSPWGVGLNFGMPIIVRDTSCAVTNPNPNCTARQVSLGSGLPSWQFSVSQNFQYRRLSAYALLQGVMGRMVWDQGRHWAHLDYMSGDIDQSGATVETAKPIGYYWRAKPPDNVGIGGFYDILGPNNYTVENSSYAKLRELSVSYNVGPVSGIGNWTASVIGRNLFTITKYKGFDPEVGQGGGLGNSGAINAVDAFTFPNTRSFTFALSTSF
ncbi:MAG TPA: SusC/RagA family TonB-linked outer membrane protein [Gemmatimonadales bacterium]